MTTLNPAGHPHSSNPPIQLPGLTSYSSAEWAQAEAWPAVARYRYTLSRETDSDPRTLLRMKRHDKWLMCALATFFNRAPARDVCEFWSDAADELIREAWELSGCAQSEMVLLALGKLGSRELNLSSDVDLIALRADGSTPDLKALREFQTLLSDTTEFGFCLRVDFTLRPGGRSSPALPTQSEFEYHYGYHGEMWERLAFVRMRILAGPEETVSQVRDFSRKFSYRKHLDYTLVDELKSLRAKIRQEKFESRPGLYHLKLGEGGIRELELFVHALQVIHGGRNPLLQTHSTSQAIERLFEIKVLSKDEARELVTSYWYLRDLENRLHAFEDQQNYLIDLRVDHPALPTNFQERLAEVRERVIAIATSFFIEGDETSEFPEELSDQQQWLTEKGFSRDSCEETWPALMSATAQSRKTERDETARITFLKGFALKLSESKLDRDLALSLLLDFVKAVRAKASFFTLLNRETRIRDELAQLFSVSPYLGSILASRPELIDEFIYRKLAPPSSDMNLLLEELTDRRLLAELISANHFLVDRDLAKLCTNITDNADAISMTLLSRLRSEYGPSEVRLLPLGKWGGRELGLRSDLDFIFITPGEPSENDHKVAKRFMSRMTEPHRGGSIYSIDMRLRPSGSAGPIMVNACDLEIYLSEKAAAWERQAYTRARLLPDPVFDLKFQPAKVASMKGLSPADKEELRAIRGKLFSRSALGELDLKLSPGGLADVEFTAQIALLAVEEFSLDPSTSGMIQCLESIDANWKKRGPAIRRHYEFLRRIEQLYQLTTRLSGSKMRSKSDEFRRLALILDRSPADLEGDVRSTFEQVLEELRDLRI